jgi:colanic acid/amylovoran biosynthesis glycosyltransferase
MKLLYITVSMPYGSGEAFFIPEVKEILRQGHQVLIVQRSPEGHDVVNRDADGLQNISVRRPLLSVEIVGAAMLEFLSRPFTSLRALALLFKSRDLFTLLKNFLVFPKGLWLSRLARRWNAEHIHAQWGLTTATMALVASRVSAIPWSCTIHRGDIVENNLLQMKAIEAQFLRVISEDGVSLAADVCKRPLQGNVVMLHLGVELPAAWPTQRPLHMPPALLCPAQLVERKGQQYLIEALAILRQRRQGVHLRLAGEGDMLAFLRSLVARHGLEDSVEFLGQMGHADLLRLYETGTVDMVVLPTLHEGIPVCLMEAMAYGVPVVATPTGGIPELLHDGAGILVPPRDPAALADAIERLLSDFDLRRRLSEAGRRRVEEEYGVECVVSRLLRFIDGSTVLQGQGAGPRGRSSPIAETSGSA